MNGQMTLKEVCKALESLTPGGSEFHDDPKRCLAWIKDRLSGPFVSVKTENDELKRQLAAKDASLDVAINELTQAANFDYGKQEAVDALKRIAALADIAKKEAEACRESVTTPPTLDQLIEWARNYKCTDEDRTRFRRSFAYGNVKLHNPDITRELIDREADKLDAAQHDAELRRKAWHECADFIFRVNSWMDHARLHKAIDGELEEIAIERGERRV